MKCPSDCYISMIEEMSLAAYTCPSFLFFFQKHQIITKRKKETYIVAKTLKCKSIPSSSFGKEDIHLQSVIFLSCFCRRKKSAVITFGYFGINLAPETPECYSILFYPLHTQSLSESICLHTLYSLSKG